MQEPEPIEFTINGELDLHTFRPREVKTLIHDYIDECRERNILDLRIIHGKGTGSLRELVHAQLRKSPWVESFHLGDQSAGSWGATLVHLKNN